MKLKLWVAKDKYNTYVCREKPIWCEEKQWWMEGKLLCILTDDIFPDLKVNECMEMELRPTYKEPEHEYYGC